MSILSNSAIIGLLGAPEAAGGEIERSVRFNSSDSAYCSRVPSLAGDRKKYTFSAWTKRSSLSAQAGVFECSPNSNENTGIYFTSSNELRLQLRVFGSYNLLWTTTAIYRDTAAWYHIVVSVDTGQVSTANAVKIYVNGVEQAATYTAASGSYSQNMNTGINSTSSHHIGYQLDGANYFNGYLADIHFCDGYAYDPSYFTEFDDNGILQPISFTGSYGTNGFHLPFDDNSSAAALGTDTSGAGNNWTVNNISVAAGAGNDSLVDTPTSYGTDTGAGGEVRGNYAIFNPIHASSYLQTGTHSNGNLNVSGQGASTTIAVVSGKYYCEFLTVSGPTVNWNYIGVMWGNLSDAAFLRVIRSSNGDWFNGSTYSSFGSSFGVNDVIGVALDMDATTISIYKNGSLVGTKTESAMAGQAVRFVCNPSGGEICLNAGQRPFAYTAPSGFKALCTTNLPDPVVTKPSEYMDVKLYTGTSNTGTVTVSGLAFSPDLVWVKNRTNANRHGLADTIRGVNNSLAPNRTNGELTTQTDLLTSFNSDGFTVGGDAGQYGWNYPSASFAAWCWDAGSSTVTNTDGSITSQVRANPTAGFSIVTYTGASGNNSIGHGLNAEPELIIVKSRSVAYDWRVYSKTTGADKYLTLNSTYAAVTDSGFWPGGATSSVFGVRGISDNGYSGQTFVAYCFAPVDGYSNGFSYTGNGSTDGSFVYLGFRPRLILLKCSSTTGNWTLVDTAREGYNVDNDPLYPNLSNAEGTTDLLDITSNGFKLRTTDASVNSNAATYIGFAWAESPFNYSRAR